MLRNFYRKLGSKFYIFSFTEHDFLLTNCRREGISTLKMEASHKSDELHAQENYV